MKTVLDAFRKQPLLTLAIATSVALWLVLYLITADPDTWLLSLLPVIAWVIHKLFRYWLQKTAQLKADSLREAELAHADEVLREDGPVELVGQAIGMVIRRAAVDRADRDLLKGRAEKAPTHWKNLMDLARDEQNVESQQKLRELDEPLAQLLCQPASRHADKNSWFAFLIHLSLELDAWRESKTPRKVAVELCNRFQEAFKKAIELLRERAKYSDALELERRFLDEDDDLSIQYQLAIRDALETLGLLTKSSQRKTDSSDLKQDVEKSLEGGLDEALVEDRMCNPPVEAEIGPNLALQQRPGDISGETLQPTIQGLEAKPYKVLCTIGLATDAVTTTGLTADLAGKGKLLRDPAELEEILRVLEDDKLIAATQRDTNGAVLAVPLAVREVLTALSVREYNERISAARYADANALYYDRLDWSLDVRGEYDLCGDLLQKLFPAAKGLSGFPALTSYDQQAIVMRDLAYYAGHAGRPLPLRSLMRRQIAMHTRERIGFGAGLGRCFLSEAFRRQARLSAAETEGRRALAMAKAIQNSWLEAWALSALGAVQRTRGELAQAQESFQQMLGLCSQNPKWRSSVEIEAASQLGEVRLRQRDLAEAERLAGRAAQLLASNPSSELQSQTVELLRSRIALARERPDEAEARLQLLVDRGHDVGSRELWGFARIELADVKRRKGELHEAEHLVRSTLSDARTQDMRLLRAAAWQVLSELLEDRAGFGTGDVGPRLIKEATAAALEAHRCAWGDGPPFADSARLARSRDSLKRLGVAEPTYPAEGQNLLPRGSDPHDPEELMRLWPPSSEGITDTSSWKDDDPRLHDLLVALRGKLDWDHTTGSAQKWWKAFEEENRHRPKLVLRLAEELRNRNATITEFFLAYVYSNTDNVLANLDYLDYTRISRQARGSSPSALSAAAPASQGDSSSAQAADPWDAREFARKIEAWVGTTESWPLRKGITDTADLEAADIEAFLDERRERLKVEEAKEPNAQSWWTQFEQSLAARKDLALRLAEEIVHRDGTLDDWYAALTAPGNRAAHHLLGSLHFLRYTLLKRREEEKKRTVPLPQAQSAAGSSPA
jgi:hypothetical protein